jgi:hypothetical protein
MIRTTSTGWRRATTEVATTCAPRISGKQWWTSALVVSRVANSINRITLTSRDSRTTAKLGSSMSAFAPELQILSPTGIRVKRKLITTIETDEFGQELTLSLWCFDWKIAIMHEPQVVRYQVEYAGKKTSDLLCYRIPAHDAKPNIATTPMITELAGELFDNTRASWNFITNQHLYNTPYHVMLLQVCSWIVIATCWPKQLTLVIG